jgi:hypothetical protein
MPIVLFCTSNNLHVYDLHMKHKPVSYPYLGKDLIFTLDIIFSKKKLFKYYITEYHYFEIKN